MAWSSTWRAEKGMLVMMMSDDGEQIRVMGGAGLLSHSGFLCQPLPQCCLYSQQQSTDCCYDGDLRTFAFAGTSLSAKLYSSWKYQRSGWADHRLGQSKGLSSVTILWSELPHQLLQIKSVFAVDSRQHSCSRDFRKLFPGFLSSNASLSFVTTLLILLHMTSHLEICLALSYTCNHSFAINCFWYLLSLFLLKIRLDVNESFHGKL